MIAALAQSGLTESQRAVRDHFSSGGSFLELFLLFVALVGCVLLLNVARRRQENGGRKSGKRAEARLFDDLIAKTVTNEAHRKFLSNVSGSLRMEHPAMMLLTPGLFDQAINRWQNRPGPRDDSSQHREKELAAQIRQELFCEDTPDQTAR